jgi:hypothetical protein
VRPVRAALLAALLALAAVPAAAQVRFGAGVRVGGYDFSGRRFASGQVRRVRRLPGPPGCRIVPHGSYVRGDGTVVRGRLERCNLPARPR